MKLTEKQLAEIFKTSTKNKQNTVAADDCLGATPASVSRLNNSEAILNDFDSAQGMKMALHFKSWSEAVADSMNKTKKSWFHVFGVRSPFKTAVATMAFAFAFVVAMPEFKDSHQVVVPAQNDYANDVIFVVPFEGQDNSEDVLSSGGFDELNENQDSLFGGSFG